MLSHAWPIILVLVLVFGGGIVRSIFKAIFGGLAGTATVAIAQIPAQLAEHPSDGADSVAAHNAEAVRAAIARAAARRLTAVAPLAGNVQISQEALQGLDPALAALITGAVAAVKAQPAPPQQPVARPQKAAHHKPAHVAVTAARHTGGGAIAIVPPLARLRASHKLPVIPPSQPLAARAPFAPISAARY